jgi:hypothetical protein
MDGVACLTSFLWRKIAKTSPSWRSFNKHIEWFMEPRNQGKIVDKDYAQYISQHMGWFKDKLKHSRDTLIVHRFGSEGAHYIDAFKPNSGTVMKSKGIFKYEEGNVIVQYDMKEIPDLSLLMDNICNFLNFFDNHFSKLL